MKISEIKSLLLGKHISYYNGWNGSSDNFAIGYIKNNGTTVTLYPQKDKGWGVFIAKDSIAELVTNGKFEKKGEIDHCVFTETWMIK